MRSETCICHVAEGLQKWPCSVAFSGIHIVVSISTRGPGSPRGADPVHTRQARGRASRGRERPCLSHTCDSPFCPHGPCSTWLVYAHFLVFGLWRICFPPVLVRTGRRLPVQALGERGVLVSVTGYPRGGAPGPGRGFVTRATRNQREIWYMESGPNRVNAPLEGPVIPRSRRSLFKD